MAGSPSRSHWIALSVRGLEVIPMLLMFFGLANLNSSAENKFLVVVNNGQNSVILKNTTSDTFKDKSRCNALQDNYGKMI